MLAEEEEFRFAMLESDERMLPVPYMVTPTDIEDLVTKVVAVEEKPEGIDNAFPFVNHDKYRWRITPSSTISLWNLSHRLNLRIILIIVITIIIEFIRYILLPTKPIWSILNIVVTREVHIAPIFELIQSV